MAMTPGLPLETSYSTVLPSDPQLQGATSHDDILLCLMHAIAESITQPRHSLPSHHWPLRSSISSLV